MISRRPPSSGLLTALAFSGLGLMLYGRGLNIGYLSDDFLYLAWLDQGWERLLRQLTVDSNPRMIRPITAFGWLLSTLPSGAWIQHALSLALHVGNALLVGLLVDRGRRGTAGTSLEARLAGLLFLSCPLLTEPVLWLSAAPDLWATALALGALAWCGRCSPALWLGCFALALMAKESVVVLPLVALCWWLGDGEKKIFGRLSALLGVAAVYLVGRWMLFGGLGGYLDAQGQSIVGRFEPVQYLRNLTLQLPWRLWMPLKRAGDWTVPIALFSAATALAFVARARLWSELRNRDVLWRALGASAAFFVATWPVAPVLSVDVDHGGGRLIYFPLAVGFVGLGRLLLALNAESRARARQPLTALLLLWVPLLIANTQSWIHAGREIRETLQFLHDQSDRYPETATVWVDGNDSFHGAYVWRNGFHRALERSDLKPYRPWRLGTLAESPEALTDGSLGATVFQIGRDAQGRWTDRTECYRALAEDLAQPLASRTLTPGPSRRDVSMTFVPTAAVSVHLFVDEATSGFVSWRHTDIPRFNPTERRAFLAEPQRPTPLPLPPLPEPTARLDLRFDLSRAPNAPVRIEIRASPQPCSR